MEKDILGEVICAEKEIQKSFELEKDRVNQWLAERKKQCNDKMLAERSSLEESLLLSLEKGVKEAKARRREILREAEAVAQRLRLIKTETLKRIVEKQIAKIFPG